jgi:hypothetical protein
MCYGKAYLLPTYYPPSAAARMCIWYHPTLTPAAGGLTVTMYTPASRFCRPVPDQAAGAAATIARRKKAVAARGRVIVPESMGTGC